MISKLNRHNIFLIDGMGAFTTASLLYFVLANYTSFFGVPRNKLLILAGIACFFAIYSLVCHLFVRSHWRSYLGVIALLNTSYCILTSVLLMWYLPEITPWGLAYFVGEILLILLLVLLELRIIKQ